MAALSDNARTYIATFSAQRLQATGSPGMVVFVSSQSENDPAARRNDLFYLDIEALAAMIKGAQETDPETAAFVLIIDGGEIRTEIVRATRKPRTGGGPLGL